MGMCGEQGYDLPKGIRLPRGKGASSKSDLCGRIWGGQILEDPWVGAKPQLPKASLGADGAGRALNRPGLGLGMELRRAGCWVFSLRSSSLPARVPTEILQLSAFWKARPGEAGQQAG